MAGPHVGQPRIAHGGDALGSVVGRTVVHDDQLEVFVRLGEDTDNRIDHGVGAVVGRDHHRHRHAVGSLHVAYHALVPAGPDAPPSAVQVVTATGSSVATSLGKRRRSG